MKSKTLSRMKKFAIGTLMLGMAVIQPVNTLPGSAVLNTTITAEAASKTTKLAVSKKTIKVGATYKLKLKNNKKTVKWSRSNKNVTLSNKSKTSVTVTGKKAGKSVVKAKVNGKTYKCTFTIKEAPKISSAALNLPAGASVTLTITGASSKPVWSIANGNIASLSKVSKYVYTVTSKRAGTTLVTVKVAGKTRTCKIYVSGPTAGNASTGGTGNTGNNGTTSTTGTTGSAGTSSGTGTSGGGTGGTTAAPTPMPAPATVKVSSISLSKSSLSLAAKGATEQLTWSVSPASATNKALTWSSSNTGVATVSSAGMVTAVGNGSCTITAKAADGSGVAASCYVTVNIPAFTIENVSLVGGKGKICSVFPENVDSSIDVKNIVFEKTGDVSCIEVKAEGFSELGQYQHCSVTALKEGNVQVVAKYNGETLKVWNITITTTWAQYAGYYNWKMGVETKIWDSSMSITEKLDALKNYIKENFSYSTASSTRFYSWETRKIDCFGASDLFGDMAKDLGLKVGYADYSTSIVYEYLSDATEHSTGHMLNAVWLDGAWKYYDAQPPHT